MPRKPLNIGMIGYGFMGRAHSNAYRKVNNFFQLEHQCVLQAVCARDAAKVKAFAAPAGPGGISIATPGDSAARCWQSIRPPRKSFGAIASRNRWIPGPCA